MVERRISALIKNGEQMNTIIFLGIGIIIGFLVGYTIGLRKHYHTQKGGDNSVQVQIKGYEWERVSK